MKPDDIAISVANVSKTYRIWESPAARLISPLQAGLAGLLPAGTAPARLLQDRAQSGYRDFHALQDISFEVRKGQSLGVIGRNGSGKSTLLQVIAGTLQPTAGSVRVQGRVAALLELGSGFNPEFTGRENVFLYSSVLGFARDEIERKFPAIADFAEIGRFMEQPVKTYSSGMLMRLAFACIVNVEPDILIVDEALAVGDIKFQRKCKEWIAGLTERGVTFLFVSHSPAEVAQLTSQGILLDQGKLIRLGDSREVVMDYQRLLFGEEVTPQSTGQSPQAIVPVPAGLPSPAQSEVPPIRAPNTESDHAALIKAAVAALGTPPAASAAKELRHGNRHFEIIDFGITNEAGERAAVIYSGRPCLLYFRGVALADFNRLFAAFAIRNVNGVELFYTNTELQKVDSGHIARGDLVQSTSQVTMWLAPGDYFLSAITRDGDSLEALDRRLDVFHFQVSAVETKAGGLVNLQPTFSLEKTDRVK